MLSAVRDPTPSRVLILADFVPPGSWSPRVARDSGDASLELDNTLAGKPHLDCELSDFRMEGKDELVCSAEEMEKRASGFKANAISHSCMDELDDRC